MATALQAAGHQLTVSDLRPEAAQALVTGGARFVATPQEAATGAEVVFTCLPGAEQVEQVALGPNGLAAGLERGAVYIDSTTSAPSLIRRIGAELALRGVHVMDAPVSHATLPGRELPDLDSFTVMVGGEEAVYQRLLPIFQTVGVHVLYCGPLGSGCICKICNNLISIGFPQLLAEVFTIGVKAGVPTKALYEAIAHSSGNTPHMHRWKETVFAGRFPASPFPTLQLKDLSLAVDLATKVGVPVEITRLIQQRLAESVAKGWGGHAVRLQEERAGVQLRF